MADRIIDLPLPSRGLNTDTSPSQIDDAEAPVLRNVLVSEPGQIRVRGGWVNLFELFRDDVGHAPPPISVICHKDRMVVSAQSTDTTISPYVLNGARDTRPIIPGGSTPYTLGLSGTGARSFFVRRTGPDSWVAAETTAPQPDGSRKAVFTRVPSIGFEGSTYYIQEPSRSAGESGWDGRLVVWNGKQDRTINTHAKLIAPTSGDAYPWMRGRFSHVPRIDGQTVNLTGYYVRWPGKDKRNYQIVSHTTGSRDFIMHKPWGFAADDVDPATDGPTTNWAVDVSNASIVLGAPARARVVTTYLDRVFVGGGVLPTNQYPTTRGEYPNAIFWSRPGLAEVWPETNFIVLDDNPREAIMGFGRAASRLVIFKRRSMYMLMGADETTFSPRLVSSNIGCVDARSIVAYKSSCIFMSEDGLMMFDGTEITDLSQPAPGRGVRSELLPQLGDDADWMHRYVAATLVDDTLLLSIQDTRAASAPNPMWLLDLRSGAWTTFDNATWPTAFYAMTQPGELHQAGIIGMARGMRDAPVPSLVYGAQLAGLVAPEEGSEPAYDRVPTHGYEAPDEDPDDPPEVV